MEALFTESEALTWSPATGQYRHSIWYAPGYVPAGRLVCGDASAEPRSEINPGKRRSVEPAHAAGARRVAAQPGQGHSAGSPALGFKQRSREFRLPNDTQQGTSSDRIVKRNGDGYRGCLQTLLHDPMAPALAHSGESVLFENATNLRA
jgi:hypothetical protein